MCRLLIVACLAVAGSTPSNANAPTAATLPASEVDDQIFRWMFRATTDATGTLPWVLMPIAWGFDPKMPSGPERDFLQRMRALQAAMMALQKEPPTSAIFDEANRRLVAQLGFAPRARAIRKAAYELLREKGVLALAVERANRAGSVPAASLGRMPKDDFVDQDMQGVLKSYERPTPKNPCSAVFWFCPSGGRISNTTRGGALKVEGFGIDALERCKTTLAVRRRDPAFEAKYQSTMGRFFERAAQVDPGNPDAITAFLREVYDAAESSGISAAMAQGTGQ